MNRRNWLLLVALSFLWGAAYLVIAVALRGFPPVVVVFGRVFLAALFLTPLAIRRDVLRPLLKHPWWVLVTVLVQSTAPLLLLTYGQQWLSAGLTGVLIGAQPLFVAALATWFASDERPEGVRGILGLVMGFAGIGLLFGVDIGGSSHLLLGGILVTAAAMCYAAGSILIHRKFSFAQPLGIATSAMLVSSAVTAIPAALMTPDQMPSSASVVALVALGVVFTALTLTVFYGLIARAGPSKATLAFYLSPGVTVVLGWLLLDEQVQWSTVVGLVAIIVGSVLAAGKAEQLA
ncbi:threonine/homoserine efflux transporter RhtA [Saccharothrix saharensis]|uniref:Threonine/homoserine efflux transporter RhtA n=1 Tax=Saccharothrix saharensis TaxID=571190 RepID=A0A543JEM6_9PSEU|nr:DMT family transporter [Saccharothrix saharensis]TQM81262.1 threonine/homoserine efflux transporter RhtA [Saccharothrix saharensis]